VNPPRRWPLHPRPGPVESLSSWLERTARTYNLSVKDLLTHNLGQLDVTAPEVVDWDPPAAILAALAERTGADLAQLRMMTLAGWVPWLMDTLHTRQWDAQETFDTYIRQNSVLFTPGEAGRNQVTVTGRERWRGPWRPARRLDRRCQVCAAGADPRRALMWQLPLTVGCVDHGCRSRHVFGAVEGTGRTGAPVRRIAGANFEVRLRAGENACSVKTRSDRNGTSRYRF